MATILKPSYGAATSLTATVGNFTTSASGNLLSGAMSSVVDNTTVLAVDALVGGLFTTTATTATNTVIEVWLIASWDNATTYLGGVAPTDTTQTYNSNGQKRSLKLLAVIDNILATSQTYHFMASVAQACGGSMPDHWGLFVTHNTNTTLTTVTLKYTPIQYTNV